MAPTSVIAEVPTPAINKSVALISTTAKNDVTGLAPTIGMPVSKNQVATIVWTIVKHSMSNE
jgi:hypothetical protein